MLFDCHVHSAASADSKADPEEIIKIARERGNGVIFTEHYDYDYSPVGGHNYKCDLAAYLNDYEKYRADNVLLGVEMGLTSADLPDLRALAQKLPFDFVLGAAHMLEEIDIYIDLLRSERPTVTAEAYIDYLIKMTGAAPFIDALAHIDYPNRYDRQIPSGFDFKNHEPKLRLLFINLVKNDIVLEINSRRLANAAAASDMTRLYALYKNCGGKYVTVGSDAHVARDVYQNFKTAFDIAETVGLTPVIFRNRKMDFLRKN